MLYKIDEARSDDWQKVRKLRLAALQQDPEFFVSHYEQEIDWTEEQWRNWIDSHDIGIFLLYCHGNEAGLEEAVGITGISVNCDNVANRDARLWGSWIEPAHRGHGMAVELYQHRLKWLGQHPEVVKVYFTRFGADIAAKLARQGLNFKVVGEELISRPNGTATWMLRYEMPAYHKAQKAELV